MKSNAATHAKCQKLPISRSWMGEGDTGQDVGRVCSYRQPQHLKGFDVGCTSASKTLTFGLIQSIYNVSKPQGNHV